MLRVVVFNEENKTSNGGKIVNLEVSIAYGKVLHAMLDAVTQTPSLIGEVLAGENPKIYIWDDEVDNQAYFKFGLSKDSLSTAIISEEE